MSYLAKYFFLVDAFYMHYS